MVEKNNELVVVNNWKDDLKAEANAQCKEIANSCMLSLKQSASEYARFAVQRIFDHLIDCVNAKLSA